MCTGYSVHAGTASLCCNECCDVAPCPIGSIAQCKVPVNAWKFHNQAPELSLKK
jgi:hypothetical protein